MYVFVKFFFFLSFFLAFFPSTLFVYFLPFSIYLQSLFFFFSVDHEGMPIKGRGGLAKGQLLIVFDVQFPSPNDLKSPTVREQLKKLLPAAEDLPMLPKDVEVEEVVAKHYVVPDRDSRGGHGDSDEDDEHGHGGARTATCTGTIM